MRGCSPSLSPKEGDKGGAPWGDKGGAPWGDKGGAPWGDKGGTPWGEGAAAESLIPTLSPKPGDKGGAAGSLKPVAITVIFTSSFIFSSSTAPKMMLASSWAALWMMVEASFTSASRNELEPVTLIRMPRAPSMAPASSRGEAMAAWAAAVARFSPRAVAVPITA